MDKELLKKAMYPVIAGASLWLGSFIWEASLAYIKTSLTEGVTSSSLTCNDDTLDELADINKKLDKLLENHND